YLRAGLVAQSKMKLRPGDRLLLNEQARTNFDFSADAKWIDALISHGLLRVWAHHLPVIIFGAVIHSLHGLARSVKAQQVQAPVSGEVCDVENARQPAGMFQQDKFRSAISQPNQGGSRVC